MSHTAKDQPSGPVSQRRTSSGFVNASNTSARGASNTRVMAISRSDGVVMCSVEDMVMIGILCAAACAVRRRP